MISELKISNVADIKSKATYTRTLSGNERIYLTGDQIQPPFCVQVVVEGTGIIDKNKLQIAVEKASVANPGSRVILKGFLNFSRWVDTGIAPPVREIDGNDWSGYNCNGTALIEKRLSFRKGPTCEVVIVRGDPLRIVFRGHHGIMDGQGLKTWVDDVFRALRGEELISSDSIITDYEMIKILDKKEHRKNLALDCLPPTGNLDKNKNGYRWIRKKMNTIYPSVVAQIAALLAQEARRHFPDSNARFMVPVDLRPHQKGLKSTGNVSNPLYIEIKNGETWKDINRNIINMRFKKQEGSVGKLEFITRYIPMWLLRSMLRIAMYMQGINNHYAVTGILSHIGSLDLDMYSCDGFIPVSAFFLPVHVPIVPVFFGISEVSGSTEFIISINNNLGDEERLEKIVEYVISGLKKSFKEV